MQSDYIFASDMNFSRTISAILRGYWFIERSWAEAHLPIVLSLMKGESVQFVQRTGNDSIELPFVVDPSTMDRTDFYVNDPYTGRTFRNPNIPENSIGIIPITGPLTKYNGDCGEPGMIKRSGWLMEMLKSDHVSGIVQLIDTPGGEAWASTNYTSLMKKSDKPILSFIDDMCYSLGMFFSSGSKETYLNHSLSGMGSVGSYTTLFDFKGWFEKEGIKIHEIYAPQSTDKNSEYRQALQGDYSLILEDLKNLTAGFINYVKTNRSKAADTINEWNTGKTFYAEEAIKIGLADGIKSIDQVVSKAAWLAKRNK